MRLYHPVWHWDIGQSVITIEACNDTTPTNTEAIPFIYQEYISGDTFSEKTNADVAGFTTIAGSNKMYRIEISTRSLPEDNPYVRQKA